MKIELCNIRSASLTLAIFSGAFAALVPIDGFGESNYTNWSRDLVESATKANIPALPFYVAVISSIDDQLSAGCVYRYVKGRTPIVLQGKRDSGGNFWPAVSCDVATEGKTRWREISGLNPPADSEIVSIGSDNTKALLHVGMEPFRPYIEAFRWGRVVLKNGDVAVFALEDLLPPADRRVDGGDFKEVLDEREQTRFGSSAILHSISSIRDHLTGDFIYTRRPFAALKGAKTLDGDFWPSATLYVGNSEPDWSTIGVSNQEGVLASLRRSDKRSPAVLRVHLDLYKSAIERNKYGKIVFSDGSFAVFLIANLNAKP